MSDECHERATRCCWCRGNSPPTARRRRCARLLGWRPAGMILQSFVQSEAARSLLVTSGVAVVEISRDQGTGADRHGGGRVELRDGLRDDDASGAQGLPADRLRLDADAWQRPAAAAADRLSCGAAATSGVAHEDMEVEVPITPRGGAEALVALDRPARGHRCDLLLVRHAGGRGDPGVPAAGMGGAGAAGDRRLWRHGPGGAALPGADHRAGEPLRDGAASGAPAAGAAGRATRRCRRSPASDSRSSTGRVREADLARKIPRIRNHKNLRFAHRASGAPGPPVPARRQTGRCPRQTLASGELWPSRISQPSA